MTLNKFMRLSSVPYCVIQMPQISQELEVDMVPYSDKMISSFIKTIVTFLSFERLCLPKQINVSRQCIHINSLWLLRNVTPSCLRPTLPLMSLESNINI